MRALLKSTNQKEIYAQLRHRRTLIAANSSSNNWTSHMCISAPTCLASSVWILRLTHTSRYPECSQGSGKGCVYQEDKRQAALFERNEIMRFERITSVHKNRLLQHQCMLEWDNVRSRIKHEFKHNSGKFAVFPKILFLWKHSRWRKVSIQVEEFAKVVRKNKIREYKRCVPIQQPHWQSSILVFRCCDFSKSWRNLIATYIQLL